MLLRHTGECERWKCLEGCVHPGWIEHDVNILYKNKPKKNRCKHVNIKMNLSDVCLNPMSWCFVTFGLSPGEQSKGWVAKSSKREVWGARRRRWEWRAGGSQDAGTFRHRHRKHPRQRKAREQDVFFPFSNKQTCLLFCVVVVCLNSVLFRVSKKSRHYHSQGTSPLR